MNTIGRVALVDEPQNHDEIADDVLRVLETHARSDVSHTEPRAEQTRARKAPAESPGASERRGGRRVRFRTRVQVVQSDGTTVWVAAEQLGDGGMCLRSPYRADVGQVFEFRFWLPTTGESRFVAIRGRVTNWRFLGADVLLGIEFLMDPESELAERVASAVSNIQTARHQAL